MPSALEAEAAAAAASSSSAYAPPPLLFEELRRRLALAGAAAEADEIQRVLGWAAVEANAALRREASQLADVLAEVEARLRARQPRSASAP